MPLPDETIMIFWVTWYTPALAVCSNRYGRHYREFNGVTLSFVIGNIGLPIIDRFGSRIGITQAK